MDNQEDKVKGISRRKFIQGAGVFGALALMGGNLFSLINPEKVDAATATETRTNTVVQQRANALFNKDASMKIRTAGANPEIQTIYKEFLGYPLSSKSHSLLHTSYGV